MDRWKPVAERNSSHLRPRARPLTALLGSLLTAVLAVTGVGPALAVNADHGDRVVNADPANFTPHVMDGSVMSITQIGDQIVAVGTFTRVRQTLAGADIVRNGIFAFNATTGTINAGFNPNLGGGSAKTVATDGQFIYVGGSFSTVGGTTNRRLAKLTAAGALVTGLPIPNNQVNDVVVRGDRLFVGGKFTSIGGTARGAFAVVSTSTNQVLPAVNVPFAGTYNGGATGITRMDVTPSGDRVVAVGNFTTVGGLAREQIVLLDTPAGGTATVSSWVTDRFSDARNNCSSNFDSFMRDVDVAPDASYFVVTTTGAFGGGAAAGTMCDTSSRWELGPTGAGQQPSWVNYTGGDTLYGVAVTGSAVYVGGHFRWQNNPFQADQAGPGAVPRSGIAALDPVNGVPLSWNPGRPLGVGAEGLFATSQGLWVGSDTNRIGGEVRSRIALMPLAGGVQVPSIVASTLPNDVFLAQRTSPGALVRQSLDSQGAPTGPASVSDTSMDWSTVRGAGLVGRTLYYGSTDGLLRDRSFDPVPGRSAAHAW